jgi:hypothetical protein
VSAAGDVFDGLGERLNFVEHFDDGRKEQHFAVGVTGNPVGGDINIDFSTVTEGEDVGIGRFGQGAAF